MARPSLPLRLRIFQIRVLASLLTTLGHRAVGQRLITRMRSNRASRAVLDASLGFRRFFLLSPMLELVHRSTFRPATNTRTRSASTLRSLTPCAKSDYPVLFYLAPLVPALRSVFDLGGNVGNLFYSYQSKLSFPASLTWTVYDLPMKKPLGEKTSLGARRIPYPVRHYSCGSQRL